MTDGERVDRAKRVALRQPATLVDSAGIAYPSVLIDVSSGGFRVECRQLLRVGEYVVLSSGRDRALRGQIRWADGHMAGGVFLEPVDDAVG